jgi:uncharacterized protein YgbK (DUF1537 family)
MATLMGCIADDLTGATDLAALLARSGVRVSLRMGVPAEPARSDTSPVEVIALKIRSARVADAVSAARAAFAWLRDAGGRRFLWNTARRSTRPRRETSARSRSC